MEKIYTTTITSQVFTDTYMDDSLYLMNEYVSVFRSEYPDAKLKSAGDEIIDNGDDTWSYTITIKYE